MCSIQQANLLPLIQPPLPTLRITNSTQQCFICNELSTQLVRFIHTLHGKTSDTNTYILYIRLRSYWSTKKYLTKCNMYRVEIDLKLVRLRYGKNKLHAQKIYI